MTSSPHPKKHRSGVPRRNPCSKAFAPMCPPSAVTARRCSRCSTGNDPFARDSVATATSRRAPSSSTTATCCSSGTASCCGGCRPRRPRRPRGRRLGSRRHPRAGRGDRRDGCALRAAARRRRPPDPREPEARRARRTGTTTCASYFEADSHDAVAGSDAGEVKWVPFAEVNAELTDASVVRAVKKLTG